MAGLRHIATLTNAPDMFLSNISGLTGGVISGQTALFSATYAGGGIGAFRLLSPDSPASFIAGQAYRIQQYLNTPQIELLNGPGGPVLIQTGLAYSGGSAIPVTANLSLGGWQNFLLGNALPAFTSAITDGTGTALENYYFAAARGDNTIYSLRIDAQGDMQKIASTSLVALSPVEGASITDLTTVRSGNNSFLVSVSPLSNAIGIHRVNTDGSFGAVNTLEMAHGSGISQPLAVEAAYVGGRTYLVIASSESSSLTTVQLMSDGRLVPVDHVIDELGTRFQSATAMTTATINGRSYVFVGGGDDGFSVFTVTPGGRLLYLDTMADTDAMALADVSALKAVVLNGKISLFAASQSEKGITQFSFDPGNIGQTSLGGAVTFRGGNADDMLQAGVTTRTLDGGLGDDILIATNRPVTMSGGRGRDKFVITADVNGKIVITDFVLFSDSLDLSHVPMLRSVQQVSRQWASWGLLLSFGNTVIEVRTTNGVGLPKSRFNNDMFPTAHYLTPLTVGNGSDNGGNETDTGTDGGDTSGGGTTTGQISFAHIRRGLAVPERIGTILHGTAGNDRQIGPHTSAKILGYTGHDTIIGGISGDWIWGGAGRDRIFGFRGNDALNGGDDWDSLYGQHGNDLLLGLRGNDYLDGGAGDDELDGGADNDTLLAGAGNDLLYGRTGHDRLFGGDGHDLLIGDVGNDLLAGDAGNDTIMSGSGLDTLYGGNGNDLLLGGEHQDTMYGGNGDDQLHGLVGNDWLYGNAGNDLIAGGRGNNHLFGDEGNDTLTGGPGSETLIGGAGNDVIYSDSGSDLILGASGNDTLWGHPGDDTLVGGEGDDLMYGGQHNDQLFGWHGNDRLFGQVGNDQLFGQRGADTLDGGFGWDSLWGGYDDDKLTGGSGNDHLYGDDGDDELIGGYDHDRLDGGSGRDQLFGDSGQDTLFGGAGNDLLSGGAGNDTLFGNQDLDTLDGGLGKDLLFGGMGPDHFVFRSSIEIGTALAADEVRDFVIRVDKLDLSHMHLSFIQDEAFSAAGQVRVVSQANFSRVEGDLDGDGSADFSLIVYTDGPLQEIDFIL